MKKSTHCCGDGAARKQRPERATVHHADAAVIRRLEGQRIDIVTPFRRFA